MCVKDWKMFADVRENFIANIPFKVSTYIHVFLEIKYNFYS